MSLLLPHLTLMIAQGHTPVLLMGRRAPTEQALDQLHGHPPPSPFPLALHCCDSDAATIRGLVNRAGAPNWSEGIGGVILTDLELADLLLCQAATRPLKDRGVPVATAHQRLVFTAPPPPFGQGMSYEGMFSLAGWFAASLNIPGDYLEFGVFDGRTLSLAYHTLGQRVPGLRLFGFDSFAGMIGSLPEETPLYRAGSYYANPETFWHNMAIAGVPPERVRIVPGDMLETLANPPALHARLGLKRCLVAHIDCDVYRAAKAALDFLTDLLDSGSLLLFDEYEQWGGDNQRGERRALREWLAENPRFTVEPYRSYTWASRAFIVQRVLGPLNGEVSRAHLDE